MSDLDNEQSGGGIGALRGPLIFIVIVALWTGFNQFRLRSNITSGCMGEFTDTEAAEFSEFCGCVTSKAASGYPILATVPFVGRIFAPSEEEEVAIGTEAGMACVSKLGGAIEGNE